MIERIADFLFSNFALELWLNFAKRKNAKRKGKLTKDRICPTCHLMCWFSTKSPSDWISFIRGIWCIATSNQTTSSSRQLNQFTWNCLILVFVKKWVHKGLSLKADWRELWIGWRLKCCRSWMTRLMNFHTDRRKATLSLPVVSFSISRQEDPIRSGIKLPSQQIFVLIIQWLSIITQKVYLLSIKIILSRRVRILFWFQNWMMIIFPANAFVF